MYIERSLSKIVNDAAQTFPVVLITGARQVGKTTVFERCRDAGRTMVTLDDPQIKSLAQNDPSLFLQTFKAP